MAHPFSVSKQISESSFISAIDLFFCRLYSLTDLLLSGGLVYYLEFRFRRDQIVEYHRNLPLKRQDLVFGTLGAY